MPLERPDWQYWQAAAGYAELGMFLEAELGVEEESEVSHALGWGDLFESSRVDSWNVDGWVGISVFCFSEMHQFVFNLIGLHPSLG